MSKIKLIIISIIIFIFVLFIFNYKNIYAIYYKQRAKDLIVEKMKDKYNIDINISKIEVGGNIFSYNPVCRVEFEESNKKYYAIVDTLKGIDSVYDNYQYNDIKNSLDNYLKKEMGVNYSRIDLYYIGDIKNNIPFNYESIKYITDKYFDGKNYKEVFKNGRVDLTYDVDIIDEEKIKKVFSVFPKSFEYYITYNNKELEKEDYVAEEITCQSKHYSYDGSVRKEEQYRLDFGNIKAYGDYNFLKGANIVKTEPFDLYLIKEYKPSEYKVISDFYRTSCGLIDYEMISFYLPFETKNKSYSVAVKEEDKDGNIKYSINDAYPREDGKYILFNGECWNKYNEYVLLERLDY